MVARMAVYKVHCLTQEFFVFFLMLFPKPSKFYQLNPRAEEGREGRRNDYAFCVFGEFRTITTKRNRADFLLLA